MIGGGNNNTKELIVNLLSKNPDIQTIKKLHQKIQKYREISLQSVNTAVHKLVKETVLIKEKTKISLNREWIINLQEMFADYPYLNLHDGDSLKYNFESLQDLDIRWKHIAYQLIYLFPEAPIFMSAPHDIWSYVTNRTFSQLKMYSLFGNKKRNLYYVLHRQTDHDVNFKKYLKNLSQKNHVEFLRIPKLEHSYITIIGDYIIETRLDKRFADKIDIIYETSSSQETLERGLSKLFRNPIKCSTSIRRNKKTC